MPVYGVNKMSDSIHVVGTPDAALQFLCDGPWGSIGDLLLLLGMIAGGMVLLMQYFFKRSAAFAR
jgi:hypothetical protein